MRMWIWIRDLGIFYLGSGIWEFFTLDPGSGMEKFRIRKTVKKGRNLGRKQGSAEEL
jgi:hypothetical protein